MSPQVTIAPVPHHQARKRQQSLVVLPSIGSTTQSSTTGWHQFNCPAGETFFVTLNFAACATSGAFENAAWTTCDKAQQVLSRSKGSSTCGRGSKCMTHTILKDLEASVYTPYIHCGADANVAFPTVYVSETPPPGLLDPVAGVSTMTGSKTYTPLLPSNLDQIGASENSPDLSGVISGSIVGLIFVISTIRCLYQRVYKDYLEEKNAKSMDPMIAQEPRRHRRLKKSVS